MRRSGGIQQVADLAGVSITTVSHALSGKGRLAPSTRERIRRIAEELNYRPHAGARSLAGGKSGLLGLALSASGPPSLALTDLGYFVELMGAASETALAAGYALVLIPRATPARDPFEEFELDGALIIDPAPGDPSVSRLRERGVPVVTTGRVPDDTEPDFWVDNDHRAATLSVLRHLDRLGARRIALVTAQTSASYVSDIVAAYDAWCAEHAAEPLIVSSDRGDLTDSAGFGAGMRLLEMPSPPDAVYATADRVALGVLLAAKAHGVRVPDDLLVAGGSDSEAARHAQPSLTTLDLHPGEIGREAVKMLVALVDASGLASTRVTVPTRVTVRGSTRRRAAARAGS